MRLIFTFICVCLFTVPAYAECPSIPAEQRARIVACDDDTFSVEILEKGKWETYWDCGLTAEKADKALKRFVSKAQMDDEWSCAKQRKEEAGRH